MHTLTTDMFNYDRRVVGLDTLDILIAKSEELSDDFFAECLNLKEQFLLVSEKTGSVLTMFFHTEMFNVLEYRPEHDPDVHGKRDIRVHFCVSFDKRYRDMTRYY